MKKISLEIVITQHQRQLTFRLLFIQQTIIENDLIKTNAHQKSFNCLQKLTNQLIQLIQNKMCDFAQLSQLRFTLTFSSQVSQITVEECKFRFANRILNLLLLKCRFLTSLYVSFRGLFFLDENEKQTDTNQCNLLVWQESEDAGMCQFIKNLTFANEILNSTQINSFPLKPFTYLSNLNIINHNINNHFLCSISKAPWPNLSSLVLMIQGNTADGIKYLRKHSFNKLRFMSFRVDIGQEASRKLTKIDVLKQLQIVPETYYLFELMSQSEQLLNMKRNIFVKELMKSPLVDKYLNCRDLYELKFRLMSDGRLLLF